MLILDMLLESLGLIELQDRRHPVDDELIYSLIFLFERGNQSVQRKVISIVTKILTNVHSDIFTGVTMAPVFRVSDSAVILYFMAFYEHEKSSVRRGLANNTSVFVLVNVILFLGEQQS
jgi:hypothetical protein